MIIVGAGSAGIETLEIIKAMNTFKNIVFYDDKIETKQNEIRDYQVLTNLKDLESELIMDPTFCVAIGTPRIRKKLYQTILKLGGKPTNAIYPNRVQSITTLDENGIIIQPGVNISYGVKIGKSCIIHANSCIGHKVTIGNFVNISPLCAIIGPCTIGNETYIGSGSTINPKINIGNNVYIKPGSIVTKDVHDFETY